MSKYSSILVTGNGRSGTNWVLDILNMSPSTHCRNEPHRISSSPFHILTQFCETLDGKPDIADIWDEAAAWTACRFGERDPYVATQKKHLYPLSRSLELSNLLLKLRKHQLARVLVPNIGQAEWLMPWWMGNNRKLQDASAVFKIINTDPRNITWLLANRPNVPIIHMVRHPGGRLNSWLTRFLPTQDERTILNRNRMRLEVIQQIDKEWAKNFSDIGSMTLIETEVWLWRYFNEKVYQIGQTYQQYICIIYEEITQDPLGYAEKIYDFCNLSIDQKTREIIEDRLGQSVWGKLSGTSQSIAEAWKTNLSSDIIDIINRVLDDSLMKDWWHIQRNS